MYERKLLDRLREWKIKSSRKPLILRGARQVGKTTLVNMFAKEFDFFIPLNLELEEDKQVFSKRDDIHTILQLLYLRHRIRINGGQTLLLFIDEIQN